MSSPLKSSVKLRLAFNSYNRCAFPGCNRLLTEKATAEDQGAILGEAAHIRGEKPSAARYDLQFPEDEVNGYDNLIYLCGDHHTLIDKQEKTYTVEMILGWKADHERTMQEKTEDALLEVTFVELEIVTKALIESVPATTPDLNLTPPEEKIKKNDLSNNVRFQISLGLGKSREVGDFIHEISTTVRRFDERLVRGFRAKYDELWSEGLRGDPLFDEMLRFACNGKPDAVIRAAGLAILSHLFETCDVFEQ